MSESEFSGTYHYVVVRESLTPTQLHVQGMHASRDNGALSMSLKVLDAVGKKLLIDEKLLASFMPPQDTRIVFLVATKARMQKLLDDLMGACIPFIQNKEIAGDLQGVITSVSFMVMDQSKVEPFTAHLPKAKLVRVANELAEDLNDA